jgi:hypothetical protein
MASHDALVDLVGIEPTTSSMPWKRAPKLRHRPTCCSRGNLLILAACSRFVNASEAGSESEPLTAVGSVLPPEERQTALTAPSECGIEPESRRRTRSNRLKHSRPCWSFRQSNALRGTTDPQCERSNSQNQLRLPGPPRRGRSPTIQSGSGFFLRTHCGSHRARRIRCALDPRRTHFFRRGFGLPNCAAMPSRIRAIPSAKRASCC